MIASKQIKSLLAGVAAVAVIGTAMAQGSPPNPAKSAPIGAGQQSSQGTPMGVTGTQAGGTSATGSTAAGSTSGSSNMGAASNSGSSSGTSMGSGSTSSGTSMGSSSTSADTSMTPRMSKRGKRMARADRN